LDINFAKPIILEHTGKRGRPRKKIDLAFLRDAMDPRRRIPLTQLANKLGIHRNTLRYYLKVYGVDNQFSAISDTDLDILVKTFRETKPDSGLRYLVGFLRQHGLKVQGERVRASVARVDKLGRTLRRRRQEKIKRREYRVSRPNALWHIDGHHKLILWGIVIHGCVDGFSRTASLSLLCEQINL